MSQSIDIYCERLDPTFWAEPLNAVSNAGFIVAALMAYRLASGRGVVPIDQAILCALIGVIGIGSFLFHTFATAVTQLADVVPIAVYQLTFLSLYARRVMKVSRSRVLMLILGFVVMGKSFGALPPDWLNGSLMYAPAFLFLGAYAIYHRITFKIERNDLLIATGLFAVSLTFRSVDMAVCDALPIGVHYMWHMINAAVLYFTVRAYIVNRS